ncbi:MAG: hypothetical protein SOY64_08305 [Pyramidobacter sp.]|uniref:hypothetical protein n=1 Tax=Pyramidobacter sp. TaxID=1943581 RepID=UPI002A8339D7|nr:hypothetical protein [Pyramidobacter sp.]MDY4033037.1 hypothetical protein [Pyramidobacter sp.]
MTKYSTCLGGLVLVLSLLASTNDVWAAQKKLPEVTADTLPVVLEADGIEFDEVNHLATARGHAVVRYTDLVFRADRVTLDSETNVIRAFASAGKKIKIQRHNADTLTGDFLEYHLNDSTGYLEGAEGSSKVPHGAVYIKGARVEIADPQTAHEKKWLRGKYLRGNAPDSAVVRWNSASYTTCKQEHPHYLLRSKKIVMVPGKYIVLHHPRVYAGSAYLFTMPFNMVVNQKPKAKNVVTIMPNYDSDKHLGLEARSTFSWDAGQLALGAGIWQEGMFEYRARVDQQVAPWLSLYAGDNHQYDSSTDETKSRPFWGVALARSGWAMDIGWAQREKRSVVRKPGQKEYETTLWRDPEVELTSPWVGLHIGDFSQYARFKGNWGRFQETGVDRKGYQGDFIERYGWGIDYYTEYPFRLGAWTVSPFFKGDYWNYGYKNDGSDRQIVTIGTLGVRASCGGFEIGSAFEQKRVSGRSAFGNGWDRNYDTDTFYQRVGVKIGPSLTFAVQGVFDLSGDKNELSSMGYILTYDNSCCTRWELTVNDDLTDSNNNDWITLSFAITAFPDSRFKIGNENLSNPFGRPGGLVVRRQRYEPTLMEKDGTEQAENTEIAMPKFDV